MKKENLTKIRIIQDIDILLAIFFMKKHFFGSCLMLVYNYLKMISVG